MVADHADPDESTVVALETARGVGRVQDIFVPFARADGEKANTTWS